MMLAKLPDGRYTIIAKSGGKTERRNVTIEHGEQETVVFSWKT